MRWGWDARGSLRWAMCVRCDQSTPAKGAGCDSVCWLRGLRRWVCCSFFFFSFSFFFRLIADLVEWRRREKKRKKKKKKAK